MRVYADHAATTPVSDEAWEAMQPFLREHFGNASEPHWAGREARRGLDAARAQAADALGVEHADVVFTGGASEADNIAILGRATRGAGRIVTTPLEHPAVSGAVEALERQRLRGRDAAGGRRRARARGARSTRPCGPGDLVCSLIWASNLTGVIQPVAEAAAICAERGVPLHLDAVQACPALEVDIGALPGAVTAAVAGHKLGGPKGAGLLCGRGLATLEPVLFGGGQERALRPGTESVAQAAGLAAALAAAARRPRALRALPRRPRQLRGGADRAGARRDDRRRARRAHAGALARADRGPARPRARRAARRAGRGRRRGPGLRERRVERQPRADRDGRHARGGARVRCG